MTARGLIQFGQRRGWLRGAVGLRCANPTYGICGEAGPHEMRPLQLKTKARPWLPDRVGDDGKRTGT